MSNELEVKGQEIVQYDVESFITMAITQKLPVETMERFFSLAKEMKQINAREQFYKSLSKFQSETKAIPKSKAVKYETKAGGYVDYHYAPIEVIVDAVKDGLEKNGFSYTLKTEQTDTKITVTCEAHHIAGHTESTSLTVPMSTGDKMNAIQQIGSAITYAKRYSFCNAFGIMTADEDTDHISEPKEEPKKEQPKADKPPVDPDLLNLQKKVNDTLKTKFADCDVHDADKLAIFYDLYGKARNLPATDYDKKIIKSALDIANPKILVPLLKLCEDFKL